MGAPVRGFFPEEVESVGDLVEKMESIGFQASEVYKAAKILGRMVGEGVTSFLGFTSNIVSSGLREIIAFMVREKWFDAVVTTVGAVEEDVMKTLGDFELGEWDVDDGELREKGINRIGNIFVRNELYENLEEFLRPVFRWMEGKRVSPSEVFEEIGRRLTDEKSFLYWAARNKIPVFCPAPTDGAFGLQLFYFQKEGHDVCIDVTKDGEKLADLVFNAERTGALVIGGGVPKHHIIGANLAREGLDYAVYITTAVEWDGSLSGARPKEGKSWGKIGQEAGTAYVYGDATVVLPLIVKAVVEWKER